MGPASVAASREPSVEPVTTNATSTSVPIDTNYVEEPVQKVAKLEPIEQHQKVDVKVMKMDVSDESAVKNAIADNT